jgi:GNAT superfamily N-acetyltransferase
VIETYKISHKKQVSPYLDEEDKKMFENKFFIKFVYKDKSGVKGWALLQPSKDRLLLNWIIVLKEYREKGIGTKILDYIKKYAKRKKFIEKERYIKYKGKIAGKKKIKNFIKGLITSRGRLNASEGFLSLIFISSRLLESIFKDIFKNL